MVFRSVQYTVESVVLYVRLQLQNVFSHFSAWHYLVTPAQLEVYCTAELQVFDFVMLTKYNKSIVLHSFAHEIIIEYYLRNQYSSLIQKNNKNIYLCY